METRIDEDGKEVKVIEVDGQEFMVWEFDTDEEMEAALAKLQAS